VVAHRRGHDRGGADRRRRRPAAPSPRLLAGGARSGQRAAGPGRRPLRPEGRALFSGLLALGIPDDPLAALWRRGDLLREFRGDSHIAAWISAGLDATEIGLLTELYWGLPLRTYIRTRAWSEDEMDAAEARLEARGLVAAGAFTAAGRAAREQVERVTDAQCRPAVEALGDDADELLDLLGPWGDAVRAAGGYPAAGPHDLAGLTGDA
jgi:hypothetical protein